VKPQEPPCVFPVRGGGLHALRIGLLDPSIGRSEDEFEAELRT
jgi:hypothetical protein